MEFNRMVLKCILLQEYAAAFLKPVKKSEAWDYDRGVFEF
jgi:hypothetical protein